MICVRIETLFNINKKLFIVYCVRRSKLNCYSFYCLRKIIGYMIMGIILC